MTRIITLLTDFGTADGYVGEMKGVLAANAPDCTFIDIAHDVSPHDVGRTTRAREVLAPLSGGDGACRRGGSRRRQCACRARDGE